MASRIPPCRIKGHAGPDLDDPFSLQYNASAVSGLRKDFMQTMRITGWAAAVAIATSVVLHGQEPAPQTPIAQDRSASSRYASFSWDRVPLYMHIRKDTSFTDKEITFLARFPLITFEKANGHKDHGSVEEGTLVAARAVKKINPDFGKNPPAPVP